MSCSIIIIGYVAVILITSMGFRKGKLMSETSSIDDKEPELNAESIAISTFKSLIASRQRQAQNIIDKVSRVAFSAVNASTFVLKSQEPQIRYVLDMPKSVEEGLRTGILKLDDNKYGEMFAQLRGSNGKFGKKIPIREDLVKQGIDPIAAMNAMQLQSIQQQLTEIIEALEIISEDIAEVIKGQYNDRLGLYYSGLNLYLESQHIENENFKQLVASQSIKALSDGCAQMRLAMESDMRYLLEGKYKKKKGRSAVEIESRMANINQSFEAIHRCYVLKSAVYFDMGEMKAMLDTIDQYGKFLSSQIVPNAPKLREFDSSDVLLEGGAWEKRAKSFSAVAEIQKRISSETVYYVEGEYGDKNVAKR